jgi:hypothetical protein
MRFREWRRISYYCVRERSVTITESWAESEGFIIKPNLFRINTSISRKPGSFGASNYLPDIIDI